MARTRSISSIETEISKVTSELQKAQEKVDELSQKLLELQEMSKGHQETFSVTFLQSSDL